AGLPVGFFGALGSRIFITLTLVFQRTLRRGFLSLRPFGRPVFFFGAALSSRGHKNCKLSIFGIIHLFSLSRDPPAFPSAPPRRHASGRVLRRSSSLRLCGLQCRHGGRRRTSGSFLRCLREHPARRFE